MRHRSRCFSVFPDEDGMYLVRGRLDPEVGAMLMRAVEAAGDALFRKDTSEDIEPKQRRADAVGLLAERALAVGFGRMGGGETEDAENAEGGGMANAEGGGAANAEGGGAANAESGGAAERKADDEPEGGSRTEDTSTPVSGSRAERYQVVLHVEAATLESEGEPGRSELEDGTRLSAELGIHFPLLTPICGGDRRIESPGWGRRLPTDAGRIRRVVLLGVCLREVPASAPVAERVRVPGLRQRRRMGDEPRAASMPQLCPSDLRNGGDPV